MKTTIVILSIIIFLFATIYFELIYSFLSFFITILPVWLEVTKEIVIIVGLVLGIYYGYPLLIKKLQEDHIKKLIEETQKSNKTIRELCHRLIEKHSTKSYKNRRVDYKELQDIYLEIREIDLNAADTSKEIASLVFLLKNTFQGVLRHYDPTKTKIITSAGLYSFYITILSEIIYFATKVVTLPKKANTIKFKLINKKIDRFLKENTFRKFKYFEIGLDINSTSPTTFLFFSHINNNSEYLFQRSAYQIISDPAPISRILYLNEIYYPVILERNESFTLFDEKIQLQMIGFSFMVTHDSTGTKKTIDIYYANLNDILIFVRSNLKRSDFEQDFSDKYIESDGINLDNINSFTTSIPEIVKINIDQKFLISAFEMNKKKLKKKMLEEKK